MRMKLKVKANRKSYNKGLKVRKINSNKGGTRL